MNKSISVMLLVALLVLIQVHAQTGRSLMSPEQKEKLLIARQRQTGGFIEIRGHGKLTLFNSQSYLSVADIESIVKPIADFAKGLRLTVESQPFSIENAKKTREAAGAGACVYIADLERLPMSLIALEDGWGVVNIAPLRFDNPDAKVLSSRIQKEIVRVTSIVFSGVKSQYKISPLQGVSSVADLDRTVGDQYGIDTLMAVVKHLPDLGIVCDQRISYREACRRGIAPAPTNDFQKAIFERVKADKERGPSKPLTIAPPAKK